MKLRGFEPGGAAADGARAQLVFASLLLALLPAFLGIGWIPTHSVKFDLPPLDGEEVRYRTTLPEPPAPPVDPGASHRLEPMPDGRILLDGAEVDFVSLTEHLNLFAVDGEWVELRPHPETRYELVFEVLALTR